MSNDDIARQLRELADRTNAEARALAPEQAEELRQASLDRAVELIEADRLGSGPGLRRVSRAPMPRPGEAGFRRAGMRP